MTPAARLQAAIDILAALEQSQQPVDRYLKDFFRTRRYAGSKDRRAITERVYDIYRQRAALAFRMGGDSARALVLGSVLAAGDNPETLFVGGGYGPEPLSDAERAIIAAPLRAAPRWVTGEYPQWLDQQLLKAFGDDVVVQMQALSRRAPVDLRVNRLKAGRDDVLTALQDLAPTPAPYAPDGIRCPTGAGVTAHPLFEAGAFEVQDEAAQIAALLVDAQPGMRVLDLTAGAGGKSLALAAAMQNRGEIVACDIRGQALLELERRAVRAGAAIIRVHLLGDMPTGVFDRVLLDAPCSGSGTWRRQPELKWRLTPARLAELTRLQDRLLDQAAAATTPGGRLVYATCSVLPLENQDRVAAFLARHPDFRKHPADTVWRGGAVPGLATDFRATPLQTGTDGFFCAILDRV
jgi:16S rRNA (cytosine967-C5)-methyltransferase